ncbi:MAG: hypothetical protein JXB32_08780 [Deltaproteobacteria bacterium]|nr:hypothetical protein [Deltaproteobacteria bacterium]
MRAELLIAAATTLALAAPARARPRPEEPTEPATTDTGPLGVAVVVSADPALDPSLREAIREELCSVLPASGFACAPREDVETAMGTAERPGPDVLSHVAEQLALPYAVAVVLYPGTAEDLIDADVFLQVRGRATGIYRGATDDADDIADTAADTAEELLRDAAAHGFGSGAATPGAHGSGLGTTAPPADDGVIDLTISETLQGIAVAYLACRSFDIQDWRIVGPTLLMGAGTGLAAALLADYYLPIGMADAELVAGGGWWGILEGGLLARTLGAGDMTGLAPWGLLGWGLGLGTGITLAATLDLTTGDVALTNSAAAWGTFAGAVIAGTILGRDIFTTDTDYDYAIPFAGLNVGLVSGIVASLFVDVSRGRMALIDLSGVLGVLLGASLGTPLIFESPDEDDKRWYSAIMLLSAGAGLTVGALLTADMDDDDNAAAAAAALLEVEPSGEVSLHVPIPRPWFDPRPSPANPTGRLGLWLGIAQGSW